MFEWFLSTISQHVVYLIPFFVLGHRCRTMNSASIRSEILAVGVFAIQESYVLTAAAAVDSMWLPY